MKRRTTDGEKEISCSCNDCDDGYFNDSIHGFAAAPSGELGGKLKIKGLAAVGVVLSADYAKVTPEEVTDEDFTFPGQDRPGRRS